MAKGTKKAEAAQSNNGAPATQEAQQPQVAPKTLEEMVAMVNRHLQVIATEKKVQLGHVDAMGILALACKGMSATIAQRKSQKVQKAKKAAAAPKKPVVRSTISLTGI